MFKKVQPNKEKALITALFLLFIGIIDTAYLTYTKLTSSKIACGIIEGCNKVATSEYSNLFGIIPLAYLGLAFYLLMFFIITTYFFIRNKTIFYISFMLSSISFIMSFYFLYIQAFKIKAFCTYCLISAAISISIFTILFVLYKNFSHENTKAN